MQIRRHILAFISLLGLVYATPGLAQVEYVRVCDQFGANYFYAPGTENCVNAITGQIETLTQIGTMHRQTHVAARVRALESNYCDGCFAVVRSNGALARSEQVTRARRVSAGRFNVLFDKPVGQCAFNATIGSHEDSAVPISPGMITVSHTPNSSGRGVTVWTYGTNGSLADKPFHLSLECKQKAKYCEVTNNGNTRDCNGHEPVRGLGPPGP